MTGGDIMENPDQGTGKTGSTSKVNRGI
jgi:hypothetical protein